MGSEPHPISSRYFEMWGPRVTSGVDLHKERFSWIGALERDLVNRQSLLGAFKALGIEVKRAINSAL